MQNVFKVLSNKKWLQNIANINSEREFGYWQNINGYRISFFNWGKIRKKYEARKFADSSFFSNARAGVNIDEAQSFKGTALKASTGKGFIWLVKLS